MINPLITGEIARGKPLRIVRGLVLTYAACSLLALHHVVRISRAGSLMVCSQTGGQLALNGPGIILTKESSAQVQDA